MKKIGEGNTAEVFEYLDKKVVKLFLQGYSNEIINREYSNARLVNSLGIPAPKVYEKISQNGRQGIIYERLYGTNMLDKLLQKPDDMQKLTEGMVKLQKSMLEKHSKECIYYKDFLRIFLNEERDTDTLIKIETLPDGNSVCHGDYHPGNVWINEQNEFMMIDFVNVCYGPKEYDIARTFYLLTRTPEPGGLSSDQQAHIAKHRTSLGEMYLEMMNVNKEQIKDYLDVINDCRKYGV